MSIKLNTYIKTLLFMSILKSITNYENNIRKKSKYVVL